MEHGNVANGGEEEDARAHLDGVGTKDLVDAVRAVQYGLRFRTADLEDVVQEASVIVWEKVKSIDESERNREGMKRFMIRTCRYMLSHEMRHMGEEERMDTWQDESRWEKVGEMLNRDDEMNRIQRRRYEKLMEVWDRLSEKDRRLLTLYYWEDKPMEEVAAVLGLKNDKVAKNYKAR
ncbi:MAG: sigma-70 family RNA polymerase sigma factor, partial [Bacteroidales bacterium]|nr:sigma-70 family RNA polymerase sigma factor [Bacteroidales bacterium]